MLTDNNYINGLFKFREKGSTKYKIFTSEKVENFIVVSFERGFYLNLKKKNFFIITGGQLYCRTWQLAR